MKSSKVLFFIVALVILSLLAACGQAAAPTQQAAPEQPQATSQSAAPAAAEKTYADMTLCYPQLGAESDWRTANTASIKETAADLGSRGEGRRSTLSLATIDLDDVTTQLRMVGTQF
ncbi:MAG: hypothetical protein P8Z00_23010 [Anaerolineales bacterium]